MPYFSPYSSLAPRTRNETIAVELMFHIEHFVIDDFWHSAHLRWDTPALPYVGQPYTSAKPLSFWLLSMVQIFQHSSMSQISPHLRIEMFASAVTQRGSSFKQHATIASQIDQLCPSERATIVSLLWTSRVFVEHFFQQSRSYTAQVPRLVAQICVSATFS